MLIEPDTLAQLWKDHASNLGLLARVRGASAEDCVQEAFLKLAIQDPPPEDPVAWLVRVVRNLAISNYRQVTRRRLRETLYAGGREEWFRESSDSTMSLARSDVELALMQLDERQRDIVVAHLWNGLTFRQLADILSIPSSTLHRSYALAIETMRQIMTMDEKR